LEFGFYDMLGNINMEYFSNIKHEDAISTFAHESIHKILTESTNFGCFHLFMNFINQDSTLSNQVKANINAMNAILFDNSVQVQESLAVFYELRLLKEQNEIEYNKNLNTMRCNSKYYKTYKFGEIEEFLRNDEVQGNFIVLYQLAIIAMNINLDDIYPLDLKLGKKMKNDYNISPNMRFSRLIQYIKNNKVELKNLDSDVAISSLCNKVKVDVYDKLSAEAMFTWITEHVIKKLNLQDISNYVDSYSINVEEDYMQFAKGYASEFTYEKEICDDITKMLIDTDAEFIVFVNQWIKQNFTTALIDIYRGKFIAFDYNKISDISKIAKCILVDRFDYVRNNISIEFQNCTIMVKLNGLDRYCMEFLENNSDKMYFLIKMNETFYMLFIKGKGNAIFYESVINEQISLLYEKLLKFYRYINSNDIGIDKEFITSLYLRDRCEDVIQWESQTTFTHCRVGEKQVLLTRINIDNM